MTAQNKDVAYLYRPLHLAVLRMVKLICDAGRAAGIPVSMCGEMAGDPVNALVLIGLGVTELSMNGPSIPFVKKRRARRPRLRRAGARGSAPRPHRRRRD